MKLLLLLLLMPRAIWRGPDVQPCSHQPASPELGGRHMVALALALVRVMDGRIVKIDLALARIIHVLQQTCETACFARGCTL
eukprot:8486812-Lingulodinium_polyedra.AAC.1